MLTLTQIAQIETLARQGMPFKQIQRMTDISRNTIDAPLPIYDWKGILGVVTPIRVTTQFGQ